MNESSPPSDAPINMFWWLNKDQVPESRTSAKPFWLGNQWYYIPFTKTGVPLRRLCATLREADGAAADYEELVSTIIPEDLEAKFQELRGRVECTFEKLKNGLPEEYMVFELHLGSQCPIGLLLRHSDGSFYHRVLVDRESALHAARGHAYSNKPEALMVP